MKMRSLSRTCFQVFGLFTIVAFAGCAEFNDGFSGYDSGYSDPYYDNGRYDNGRYRDRDDYRRRRDWEERRDDRREIERERRRVEEERAREAARHRPPPPPPRQNDRCPSGFSPSENKCSPQERKRGCRDIRLPSGLGCVSR